MAIWCANCGAGRRIMEHYDGEGLLCRGCFQYFERLAQREAAEHISQTLLPELKL